MARTAQEWLNTTYQDKTVRKVELHDEKGKAKEELTGELLIKDYASVEEINLDQWDKKGEISKVTIDNCPKLKDISFNNNKITEITFQGDFSSLERLEVSSNNLTKIDVSKFPNLTWLNVARNTNITVEGGENLTKIKMVNLLDTPGLNGQKFKEWKEGINSALGLTPKDGSLPSDWENKLNDLKKRPTQDDLDDKVKEAVSNKEKEYKDYINPNDKEKLKEAAKNADFGFTQADINEAVQKEADKHKDKVSKDDYNKIVKERDGYKDERDKRPDIPKEQWDNDYSKRPKKSDFDDLQKKIKGLLGIGAESALPDNWESKLVNKSDLDKVNEEVKGYKDGLKDKLNLDDNNLNTWRDEIDKLKNRPISDSSDKIKGILGLKPNDSLPSDWVAKLVPKDDLDKIKGELDKWKSLGGTSEEVSKKLNDANQDKTKLGDWQAKFPNQEPTQVKKDMDDLKAKGGGSGTGGSLTTEQQQKLNDYEKLGRQKEWLLRQFKNEKSKDRYAQIEQQVNNIK